MRIDILIAERGLAESRSMAQRLVMARQVRVNGQVVHKSSQMVETSAEIVVDAGPRFVSRGGEKLAAALDKFPLTVANKVPAPIASKLNLPVKRPSHLSRASIAPVANPERNRTSPRRTKIQS